MNLLTFSFDCTALLLLLAPLFSLVQVNVKFRMLKNFYQLLKAKGVEGDAVSSSIETLKPASPQSGSLVYLRTGLALHPPGERTPFRNLTNPTLFINNFSVSSFIGHNGLQRPLPKSDRAYPVH